MSRNMSCTAPFFSITCMDSMETSQQRAVLHIMIQAALADGEKADSERAALRDMGQSLSGSSAHSLLASVYQDVLLKRVRLQDAVAQLTQVEHRRLAYEMAVCVCDADGVQSPAESKFLVSLRDQLGLQGDAGSQEMERQANAIAEASSQPAQNSPARPAAKATAAAAATAATIHDVTPGIQPVSALPPSINQAELDKTILNYAILNGALELLPQSWASVAIIPLQIKMVYRIGKAHGVELDQGHIREFIATLGIGLSSQYIEQFGRKLLGGLLGKAAGKTFGKLGSAATGMAFSFAATYALGQLARRYYADGRVMSTDLLRSTYQQLLQPARDMQQQYLPAMRERAATLDAGQVLSLVRG